ncbi:MAG TPA: apolipoprotein N-acyltransferase [Thermodesulfovibrionales bacterium]|nr:apolipoprotein N-acyltransferase [Thermodesulfovibrionales bacterium]
MDMNNVKKQLALFWPSCLSGILLALSFPTLDLFPLAWIGLVPFLLSLYEMKPKQAFHAGLIMGLFYFFGTLYWIYHSINHYGGVSFITSILLVALLCSYLSLYTGVFAFLFSITFRNTKLPALLIAPAFWVVLEFLRSYAFTGFPWSSIGYSQYKFLAIIQIADITGVYGVSFLVVSVNGAAADFFLMKKRIKDVPLFPLSQTTAWASALTLCLLLSLAYGIFRLGEDRPGSQFKAAIVQGDIAQDKKWDPAYEDKVAEIYRDLSLRASSESPSLIVWPESSVPFIFGYDKKFTSDLQELQGQLGSPLLFGSVLIKEKKKDRVLLSNSAVLLDDDGKVAYTYDKIHMVPFGEYVPLGKILFFVNKLVSGIGDYTPGTRYIRAHISSGEFATLICYEIIFPGLVRKFYTNGGDFMVNITNDAWFGTTSGPYQHFSMAVFRAVENRKPLIRAANTGISGFIDSNGRVLSETGLFERVVAAGEIKTDTTRSFYSKYGDLFTYVWIVFSVILLTNIFSKIRKSVM